MKPGEWGTRQLKPAIVWYRPGVAVRGEPSVFQEVRIYASEEERFDAHKRGLTRSAEDQDNQRKMVNAQQMEQREALADAEFAQYQFGEGITVSESDNWDKNDVADFTKIVYITCDDDAPDADSERVSFHVRFNADGIVDDAYGLLMRNGGDIGTRPANQEEMDAMSETWSNEH